MILDCSNVGNSRLYKNALLGEDTNGCEETTQLDLC